MTEATAAPVARAPFWRIRERLAPRQTALLGLVLPAALVVLWWWLTRDRLPGQVESRLIGVNILPAPSEMLSRETLSTLWFDRELSRSALVSLGRVCSGFALAALLAVPLGVLMGAFSKVAALFRPLMLAGGYLPVAALVPLTLVWFGMVVS